MTFLLHTGKLVVVYTIVGAVLFGFTWGVFSLFRFGGKPEEDGLRVRYRLRPAMVVTILTFGCGGLGLICSGARDLQSGRASSGWLQIGLGLLALCLASACKSEFFMDQVGLHYRGLLRRDVDISWDDLSHLELQTRKSLVLFLRAKDGRTIALEDLGFNTGDVLKRIEERMDLPVKPYVARKWYGG